MPHAARVHATLSISTIYNIHAIENSTPSLLFTQQPTSANIVLYIVIMYVYAAERLPARLPCSLPAATNTLSGQMVAHSLANISIKIQMTE